MGILSEKRDLDIGGILQLRLLNLNALQEFHKLPVRDGFIDLQELLDVIVADFFDQNADDVVFAHVFVVVLVVEQLTVDVRDDVVVLAVHDEDGALHLADLEDGAERVPLLLLDGPLGALLQVHVH